MDSDSNNLDNTNSKGNLAILLPIAAGIFLMSASWRVCLILAGVGGAGWIWRYYHRQRQKRLTELNTVFYQLVKENQGRLTALDLAMKTQLPGEVVQQYLEKRAREFSANFEITEQGGILYYFQTAQTPLSQTVALPDVHLTQTPENANFPPEQSNSTQDSINLPAPNHPHKSQLSLPNISHQNPSKSSLILPPQIEEKLRESGINLTPVKKTPAPSSSDNTSHLIGLSQTDLAKRLQVHPNTISKRKGKPGFTQWSREKDPESVSWNYSNETQKFYPQKHQQKSQQIQLPSF